MTTTCPFCGAAVPDLAYHYGGYRCEPCREVRMAFDPAWWPSDERRRAIGDDERRLRRNAGIRRARAIRARKAELRQEGIRA